MQEFITDMRLANYSPVTITDRVELLERFRRTLADGDLLAATSGDLRAFQASMVHLAPASIDIYSRHLRAFYTWACGRRLIRDNPADKLVIPRLHRGRPHPTSADDMRIIFTCTTGPLRLAYMLAAFTGLRRGEICRMERAHLDLDRPALASALILGKGRKERVVPLLRPVVTELLNYGLPRAGNVLRRNGKPYLPDALSIDSSKHLTGLGVSTTLHSLRHAFATNAARLTKDPLFIRDLCGHQSVATTEVYMASDMDDAHLRLAGLATLAEDIAPAVERRPEIRIVGESGVSS